jgi:hypothetical protein
MDTLSETAILFEIVLSETARDGIALFGTAIQFRMVIQFGTAIQSEMANLCGMCTRLQYGNRLYEEMSSLLPRVSLRCEMLILSETLNPFVVVGLSGVKVVYTLLPLHSENTSRMAIARTIIFNILTAPRPTRV